MEFRRVLFRSGADRSYKYICDEKQIIECVPKEYAAFHTDVDKRGNMKDGKVSLISDYNSIGIAYCICKNSDLKESVKNAAIAAAAVCMEYGLDEDAIVRHYDVSQEICPITMYDNEIFGEGIDEDSHWDDFVVFKRMVSEMILGICEADKICAELSEKGLITDKNYWREALVGTGDLEPKWLRIILKRLLKI